MTESEYDLLQMLIDQIDKLVAVATKLTGNIPAVPAEECDKN